MEYSDHMNLEDERQSDMYELNNYDDLVHLLDQGYNDGIEDSPYLNTQSFCNYLEPSEFLKHGYKNHLCTSFFHLNCRGLSNNWDRFLELMSTLTNTEFLI